MAVSHAATSLYGWSALWGHYRNSTLSIHSAGNSQCTFAAGVGSTAGWRVHLSLQTRALIHRNQEHLELRSYTFWKLLLEHSRRERWRWSHPLVLEHIKRERWRWRHLLRQLEDLALLTLTAVTMRATSTLWSACDLRWVAAKKEAIQARYPLSNKEATQAECLQPTKSRNGFLCTPFASLCSKFTPDQVVHCWLALLSASTAHLVLHAKVRNAKGHFRLSASCNVWQSLRKSAVYDSREAIRQ